MLLALLGATLAASVEATRTRFWKLETAEQLLAGEIQGVAIDSEGRLRLAAEARVVYDPGSANVWAVTRDRDGTLYLGTGNEGKIFRVTSGVGALVYDTPELEVHALAVGPDGRLYAGTSPDGRVYAIDAAGNVETFYDPPGRYIWALDFASDGKLIIATGAPAGLYRVDRDGTGEVFFTSSDEHLTSLALGRGGNLYAGSSPRGIVYRIDSEDSAFALYDSEYREVKALAVTTDGFLFAALVGHDSEAGAPPNAGTSASAVTTVTVSPVVTTPVTVPTTAASQLQGSVIRVGSDGDVEVVWTSTRDAPHALAADGGSVLIGTGDRGLLYRVRGRDRWTMEASFSGGQVTALFKDAEGLALATSNPGRVHQLADSPVAEGRWVSAVHDAEGSSRWGRVSWTGQVPDDQVAVRTRSGNTKIPDTTWSEWSPPTGGAAGVPVTSPEARFLQLDVTLTSDPAGSPVVSSLRTAYLPRNRSPHVSAVLVHAPGQVYRKMLVAPIDGEILGLPARGPLRLEPTPPSQSIGVESSFSQPLFRRGMRTVTWTVEDPDGDSLTFDVLYRLAEGRDLKTLRAGLTETAIAWDTATLPDGQYVVKIVASDRPDNTPARALTGQRESVRFAIDNSPPTVTLTLDADATARASVSDDGLLRGLEYSVDRGAWQIAQPDDGIEDSNTESYTIDLSETAADGSDHVLIVRAADRLGNVATELLELPAAP